MTILASGWVRRPLQRHYVVALALLAVALLLLAWGEPDRALAGAIAGMDRAFRDAAQAVAQLGQSKWYLYPGAVALVVLILGRRRVRAGRARAAWDWLIGAIGFAVLAVALSGIVVNLAKWAIGRARPNLFTREQIYAFEPFTFDARFHSFPSGHVNTLIVIGLLAGFAWPRLRVWLVGLACLVALARLGQNAHYLSDCLGGAAVAIGTTFWLRARFAERGWVFVSHGEIRANRNGRMLSRWLKRRLRLRRVPAEYKATPNSALKSR